MGQIMGILGPLILLGAGALALIHRCDWFQICGNPFQQANAQTDSVTPPDSSNTVSTNDESNAAANRVGTSMKKGCCQCMKDSSGDVRCSRNGGSFTRYASAPQDMSKAMDICYGGCSSSNGGKLTTSQAVRCPSGYASVNGQCKKITSSSKGAPTGNTPSSPPKTTTSSSSGGIKYKSDLCYTTSGYKPCSQVHYTVTSLYTQRGIRPYPLYHRLAN